MTDPFEITQLKDVPSPPPPTRWGSWRLSGHHLVSEAGGYKYAVDLFTCVSSAHTLDWLMQIASKTWGTPVVVGDLVHAVNDVLHPQATLCSSGQDKRLTTKQIQQRIVGYRDRTRNAS